MKTKLTKMLLLLILLILLILLSLLLLNCLVNKSNFSNNQNVLIIASHIKSKYGTDIINNNLKMMVNNEINNKINLIIFVYSLEENTPFNKTDITTYNIPIVFIHDTENKFYDFYKYKLAYEYIKKNNIKINWVFVTNDSIIITENVSWIINDILSSDYYYIGILEVNAKIFEKNSSKKHYQSWWINFKSNAFDYWYNNIKFNDTHLIKEYDHHNDITIGVKNIINDFEINLSNEMITNFYSKAIFPLTVNWEGNIFANDDLFYDYYHNKNFNFVKLKHMKPDLIPKNLTKLI